jgi:hypothetical protein
VSGLGKAAAFTQLDWVRRRFIDAAGIDPYPGTVNLEVLDEHRPAWQAWRALEGDAIDADLAIVGFVWYPMKRMLARKRTAHVAAETSTDEAAVPGGQRSSGSAD